MKIKVLSYNIHKGFNIWGNRFMLSDIKSAIQDTGADIVLLQEVVGFHKEQQVKQKMWPTEGQFEFLADNAWPHFSYGKNATFPHRHHGNAILSRFPIDLVSNTDISTNKWEQRGLLKARIHHPHNQSELYLLNTHLNLRESDRLKQQDIISHEIHPLEKESMILAGDFNDWRQTLCKNFEAKNKLKDAHLCVHGKLAKTFPSILPTLTLDRVYFRDLEVIGATTLHHKTWTGLSDHLPLLVEFDWN